MKSKGEAKEVESPKLAGAREGLFLFKLRGANLKGRCPYCNRMIARLKYLRCERGYIDSSLTIIFMGLAGIIGPALLMAEGRTFSSTAASIALLLGALFFQLFALWYAFEEAKHSAYCYSSDTKRVGLNRAPAIEGAAWPIVLMVIYAVGAGVGWWKGVPRLLVAFYVLMIFVVLILCIIADGKGTKMAEAKKAKEEESA